MDWKDLIQLRADKITENNRESVFEALLQLQDYDRVDNKTFKRLFGLAQRLMQWKQEEITALQHRDANELESDRLRKLVDRLETEKAQQKVRIRQLTEEIAVGQKRIQTATAIDREDSPDALSDLDRQEELLAKISTKNKHIKRLLADLDQLEGVNAAQLKVNHSLTSQLTETRGNWEAVSVQFKDAQLVIADQLQLIEELHGKNRSLSDMVTAMQRDVESRDEEITEFGRELEQKVLVWRGMFDAKQRELESLRGKYEDAVDRHPGYNIDAERVELSRLTSSVRERDCLINGLEEKMFEMSNELVRATGVINKLLIKERESGEKTKRTKKDGDCCAELRDLLALAKKESIELQGTVLALEEENVARAKQAQEAMEMLAKYENGEAGLSEALQQVAELERKVRVRDRDIVELVKQINRSQDVARENVALREQVGMDEAEVVPTTFVEAKMRRLHKANERLTLKLRASEEMRLRMKLERNELMKQLRRRQEEEEGDGDELSSSPESDQPQQGQGREGGVEEKRIRREVEEMRKSAEEWKEERQKLQGSYEAVQRENENLRLGMCEILKKLRSGEGSLNDLPGTLVNTDRHRPPIAIPTQSSSSPSMQDESCQTDDEQPKINTESHLTDPDLLAHLKALLEENAAVQEELIELRGSKEGDSEETTTSDHLLQENALLCRRLRTTEQRCLQLVSQMHKRFVQLVMVDRKKSPSSPDHHQITPDIHSWARQLKGELASKFFEEVPEEELWRKLMVGREAEMVAVVVVEGGEGEDMASHCVTVQEYNQLVEDKGRLKQQLISVQERNGAVEEALRVVTDQLEENQRMGNRCWDEEISLRHLVVDLQAEGSEKQLLARAHRELQMANHGKDELLAENAELRGRMESVQREMEVLRESVKKGEKDKQQELENSAVKLRYLKETLQKMCANYSKYTPLVDVETFIRLFRELQAERRKLREDQQMMINNKMRGDEERDGSAGGDRMDLIRWTTQNALLERELKWTAEKARQLEEELHEQRVEGMRSKQHWMALKMVLKTDEKDINNIDWPREKDVTDIGVQVTLITDITTVDQLPMKPPQIPNINDNDSNNKNKCLESQLKQAMHLASTRNALLLETENRLAEAQGRVKAMERVADERDRQLRDERENKEAQRGESVLSSTVASLQSLVLEREATLSRYQDLLKVERKANAELQLANEEVVQERDALMEEVQRKRINDQNVEDERVVEVEVEKGAVEDMEMSFNLLDSNRLDEMFVSESREFELAEKQMEVEEMTVKCRVAEEEVARLQAQLMEVSQRERGWETAMAERDLEIERLKGEEEKREEKEKRHHHQESGSSVSLDGLRELLEEKDRHIHDLTKTLSHFHDDQQCYLQDTTLSSAEDMARMASERARIDATNQVLSTQIEALQRQMANLEQRERQARELVKTLKQQLVHRPVISVGMGVRKTQTANRSDQCLQRRVDSLQSELAATRDELRKQTGQLWEKQKRSQQAADKLRLRLGDREQELEKVKGQLVAARQTVGRMERERQAGEAKRERQRAAAETPETEEGEGEEGGGYYGEIVGVIAVPQREKEEDKEVVSVVVEDRSQSLRLEARNLQLQLENDLLRKGDEGERQKRQIKHLEDYVLVLKEELSEAVAAAATAPGGGILQMKGKGETTKSAANMEQTILALKRILERLRVENKALREGRMGVMMGGGGGGSNKQQQELKRVQDLYAEALNKITAMELGKGGGGGCCGCVKGAEWRMKLEQKTELLEKAKVLLTRAAAKEKNLREQIEMWKRRCSELQNVPVIEEISE